MTLEHLCGEDLVPRAAVPAEVSKDEEGDHIGVEDNNVPPQLRLLQNVACPEVHKGF